MKSTGTILLVCLLFVSPVFGAETAAPGKPLSKELIHQLDLFTQVLHNIQDDYLEPVSDEQLIQGAIEGMVATLDPHTQYLLPEDYQDLEDDTAGRFGGVGLEVAMKEESLTIVTPLEGTPAEKAGLRAGDKIMQIDGVSTRNRSLQDLVKSMRGATGTSVDLMIQRGTEKTFKVTLTRARIHIKSVRTELLEDRFAYLRISSFQEGTGDELKKGIRQLERRAKPALKGLILDLRNNPGGLLNEAVAVADIFLEGGTIVSVQGRDQKIEMETATVDGTIQKYPLLVLVNEGSASAAEIVAGALQDQKRGVLLGMRTFGKGSVQTVYELGDGAALKLTISKYYTPSGRSIQANGIQPDIVVATKEEASAVKMEERFISEKDLVGHLEDSKSDKLVKGPDLSDDFQKKVALDFLKSWTLFGGLPTR